MCGCTKNKGVNITHQIFPSSGKTMKEFVVSNGWSYAGTGGCCDNVRDRYRNPAYPKKEIWINERIGRMEFRQLFATELDSKTTHLAGKMNFEHIYKIVFE